MVAPQRAPCHEREEREGPPSAVQGPRAKAVDNLSQAEWIVGFSGRSTRLTVTANTGSCPGTIYEAPLCRLLFQQDTLEWRVNSHGLRPADRNSHSTEQDAKNAPKFFTLLL